MSISGSSGRGSAADELSAMALEDESESADAHLDCFHCDSSHQWLSRVAVFSVWNHRRWHKEPHCPATGIGDLAQIQSELVEAHLKYC